MTARRVWRIAAIFPTPAHIGQCAAPAILAVAAAMLVMATSSTALALDASAARPVQQGDWVIETRRHTGCDRHRWCKARRWNSERRDYDYFDCYWGGCAMPDGRVGGYGGHDGRGY